ncbi:hypothetical protein AAFC00_002891 [Neodothiora populina]|uniref:Ras modification protein ERF4 n=1 Tax=Neodothiora populina TaxID=2781224 RepID=A0ABR3P8K8_9PEZI
MQTMNQMAGVHDPAPAGFPEPPPIPQDDPDLEGQTTQSIKSRPSRSSLPPNRQPSRRTMNDGQSLHPSVRQQETLAPPDRYTMSRHSAESSIGGSEMEIEWGPRHPCYPHPNPHVPLDSPEYTTTRIIRVQRDWLVAGDLYPAFQNLYPEILIGYVSEDDFRKIIETTNKMLKEAFNPWATGNWFDAFLGIATGFLWDNTGLTATKRKVARLERWVDEWNYEAQRGGNDVLLIGPRKTGFLTLDIQIPDPKIDDGSPTPAHT